MDLIGIIGFVLLLAPAAIGVLFIINKLLKDWLECGDSGAGWLLGYLVSTIIGTILILIAAIGSQQ